MIGETIQGRYRIEERLSAGLAGTVYHAVDMTSDTQAEVRFLDYLADPGRAALTEDLLARFEKLSAVEAFGIVRVFDFGIYKGVPYLVTAIPDGVPLSQEIALAPLAMERVVHIAHEIAQLLLTLHSHGIVHGDLRPANVILQPTRDLPFISLTGYGTAKARGLSEIDERDQAYMAPEQVLGQAADGRADLYSLGAILHVLATGQPPSRVGQILSPAPRELNARIPPSLEKLILELLAVPAEERPGSAEEVAARLQHIGQNDLYPPGGPTPSDEPQVPGPPSWELE